MNLLSTIETLIRSKIIIISTTTRYQSILNRIKVGFFHIPARRRRCLETMNTHSTKRYLIIFDSSQPPGYGGNYYRFQEWFTHFFVLSFLFLLYQKLPPIIWVFSRYHQPILCKCGLLLHAWLAKSWKLGLIHLFSRIKIVRGHYKFCLMCFYGLFLLRSEILQWKKSSI